MHPNEGRPGCCALALWCGQQSVALQDIADRLIADLVPKISQRPRNPVITPVTVLLGHANDQLLNLSLDPRSSEASTSLRNHRICGQPACGTRPGWCPVAPYWPPRREPCGPTDDRSRRAWLARRPRALAALSTWLSECDFRRPDIHCAPAAPGPSSP